MGAAVFSLSDIGHHIVSLVLGLVFLAGGYILVFRSKELVDGYETIRGDPPEYKDKLPERAVRTYSRGLSVCLGSAMFVLAVVVFVGLARAL